MPIRPENAKRYPPDWPAISRRIRFDRAGGRCECTGQCGLHRGRRCVEEHGKPAKFARGTIVLTTMHLNHQEEDCAFDPLLWKPWRCACGWAGLSEEMTVGAYDRVCPSCGGSGGLILADPTRNNLLAGCQRCHLRYDRQHHKVSAGEAAGQQRLALEELPSAPA